MSIVLLKLLGYAIGSVVMYWGLLLLLVAPWALALLLVVLLNAGWNQITGKTDEWQWFLSWTESVMQVVHRLKFEWLGWIPGILIQIWYAGYAAHLVNTSALEKPSIDAIALQFMGVMGIVTAAAIFYWLYRLVVEVKLARWIYILVSGISLIAYFVFLQQPQVAKVLGESWQQIFAALLAAMT
ncbi:MAG TPA: hypothetical protein IGS53_02600 [Leptolyngbyaceae cyanobacterium M33_DOE_097]|uniref:Uncharacterized protein n=1 Tax=Oscillatoriales cyanobacterium SpSt-418 TaxID=2282169 RepID=A0A7C3KBR8_9CYAN|nr:hypothetical protein [Leptolyngbyaceae cyanobacterium M33_DOE_097]